MPDNKPDQIIYAGYSCLASISGVSKDSVTGAMLGQNGFDTVTTGAPRPGEAVVGETNAYNINLPGTPTGIGFGVTFTRR